MKRYVRRKPKRIIPWRKIIIITAMVLGIAVGFKEMLMRSPRFIIRKVVVLGAQRYAGTDFEKLCKGKSLLRISPAALKKYIEEMDGIASADVQRIFPYTVQITLHERKALGMVKKSGQYYLIDKEGKLFERTSKDTYPIIIGDKNIPEAVTFLDVVAKKGFVAWSLREVDCRRNRIVCTFTDTMGNTRTVNVGRYDYEEKAAALQEIAAKVGDDDYYIDVRFVPYAIVRKGGGV